jgi:hypothetical protein
MRLALVFNPDDRKLSKHSYSHTYRDMFKALIERFEAVVAVTNSCKAADIKADVIIVYDVHSSHHIEIEGLKDHKAVKYTYFNDPHQLDFTGFYKGNIPVNKLGAEKRCSRAQERGIQYIICPYKNGFEQYIRPHTDIEHVWFPVAPRPRRISILPLDKRGRKVLCHGHVWKGTNGFHPYEFRRWAMEQPNISILKHHIQDHKVPSGNSYQTFLAQYAGAMALCDTYVVPKYLEIPLSGALCFAQWHQEYEEMGFKDMENCIYVDAGNFQESVQSFLAEPGRFQSIADAGRETALNWTAGKFAEFIYRHAGAHYAK